MDAASQIIAKWLELIALNAILKIFGGAAGGGGGGGGGFDTSAFSGSNLSTFNPGNSFKFAEGGFVTGPTNAVIGEAGQSEYVIPASKMTAAMQRYGSGARGSAVLAPGGTSGSGEAANGIATMGPMSIDVRYTVERINSVDYVTADQFQQGLRQAASQGAKQGEQNTLRRLQNAPSIRKRVGI